MANKNTSKKLKNKTLIWRKGVSKNKHAHNQLFTKIHIHIYTHNEHIHKTKSKKKKKKKKELACLFSPVKKVSFGYIWKITNVQMAQVVLLTCQNMKARLVLWNMSSTCQILFSIRRHDCFGVSFFFFFSKSWTIHRRAVFSCHLSILLFSFIYLLTERKSFFFLFSFLHAILIYGKYLQCKWTDDERRRN